MRVSGGKVFIKIQDNTNKEEIKPLSDNHLSHLMRKFPDPIFNSDD